MRPALSEPRDRPAPAARWAAACRCRTIKNYYVSTTGSDSAAGTSSGTAWLTLAHALNVINGLTIAPNYNVIINLAAGNYNSAVLYVVNHPQGGQIQIMGDASIAPTTFSGAVSFTPLPAADTARSLWPRARESPWATTCSWPHRLPRRRKARLVGCHKVTAIDGNVITMAVNRRLATIAGRLDVNRRQHHRSANGPHEDRNANGFNLADNTIQYSLGLSSGLVIVSAGTTAYGIYGGNMYCPEVGVSGFAYGWFGYYG